MPHLRGGLERLAGWQSRSSDVTYSPKATGSVSQVLCSVVGSRYRVMGDTRGQSRGSLGEYVCWEGVYVRSGLLLQRRDHNMYGKEL